MKKSIIMFAAAICATLFVTGCMTKNTSQGAYMADIKIEKTYQAVIDAQNKQVSGEATVNNLFGFITWGVSDFADEAFTKYQGGPMLFFTLDAKTAAKQGATYNACEAANADMLLGAKYVIDTQDYIVYKRITCKATGTPANLKGIK